MVEGSALIVGAHDRVTLPVGRRPVSQVCMYRRTGTGMFVVEALVMIPKLDNRHEPVPVQHGHIVILVSGRVPTKEMIVEPANFAR